MICIKVWNITGRDINLDVLRVQGYRHFCNKIWNASRFTMTNIGDEFTPHDNYEVSYLYTIWNISINGLNLLDILILSNFYFIQICKILFQLDGSESLADKWILSRLAYCTKMCNDGFEEYGFSKVTTACYNFWLYEFCDVYLVCFNI